jgi:DNA processing protein
LEQGRSVFSVPGRAEDPQAMGTNKLLKDGAALVESFDDILAEFEFLPGMANAETKAAVEPTLDIARLEGNEKTVAEFLEVSGESSADQIIAGTGISAGDALAALMGLKLRKIVSEASGKRFALKK